MTEPLSHRFNIILDREQSDHVDRVAHACGVTGQEIMRSFLKMKFVIDEARRAKQIQGLPVDIKINGEGVTLDLLNSKNKMREPVHKSIDLSIADYKKMLAQSEQVGEYGVRYLRSAIAFGLIAMDKIQATPQNAYGPQVSIGQLIYQFII